MVQVSIGTSICMHGLRKFCQRRSKFDGVLGLFFLVGSKYSHHVLFHGRAHDDPTLNAGLVAL